MLDREEYIEQAYFFDALRARIAENVPTQDLLSSVREEILSTTKLPMAVDFLAGELRLMGVFSTAMAKLPHYFTPFQTFVMAEAEKESGRFDLLLALEILAREARYRAEGASPQGIFLYEFECIARNRLGYDRGLGAMAGDELFDPAWREWILLVRRQVGIVDLGDLIYLRSAYYHQQQERKGRDPAAADQPALFGEKEGKIAVANRQKDPMLLFAALHRQLGYPEIPRRVAINDTPQIVPALLRRVERIEARMKLLEEEQRGGLDITKFYGPQKKNPWIDADE